jgi:hypothetical protein
MSNIIIGIHGLGNKPDAFTLESWWRSSLLEGTQKRRETDLKMPFEMVYWAHLLHSVPLHPDISDPEDPLYIEDPYVPGMGDDTSDKPSELRKKILHYLGHQLENIFLKKDLTINFSSVNDFVIKHFFKDLAMYYDTFHEDHTTSDLDMKRAVRDQLANTLIKNRKKKILLIAHSMGAIIAYDVLTQLASEVEIDTLVTIGCPLGVPIIRSKIAAEHKNGDAGFTLRTPENVLKRWYNLSDLRDKIAIYYQLSEEFESNSHNVSVIDMIVSNGYQFKGEKNPHKSYGYLKTPELAEIIDNFLRKEPFAPLVWIKKLFGK